MTWAVGAGHARTFTDTAAGAVRDWLRAIAFDDVADAWSLSTIELRLVLAIWLDGPGIDQLAELGPAHPRWSELRTSIRTRFAGDGGMALLRFVAGAHDRTEPWVDPDYVADEDEVIVPEWYVVTLTNGPRAVQFTATRRDGLEQRRVRWRVGAPGAEPRSPVGLRILARQQARAAESPLEAILRRAAGA